MKKTLSEYLQMYDIQNHMGKELMQHLKLRHYQKGDYLMNAGSLLKEIVFIVNGRAKTLYITHNGESTLHSFLNPFMVIGDVEFFQQHRIINDVIALCDMDCLILPIQHKESMLKDANFMYMLASQLSQKLIRSNHNKSVSLTYPVENRLAAYICASMNQGYFYDNQQDAADMIGCSYRQLQRVLCKFIKEGYIEKKKKGVYQVVKEQDLRELGSDIYVF
ncbi:cyclic nucleotide-binding domain-containing protein [Amedibacillus sp. YH-ame6]